MCCVTVSVVTCECVDLIVHYSLYRLPGYPYRPYPCHSARRTTCVVKEARALEAVAYPAPRRAEGSEGARKSPRLVAEAEAGTTRRRLGRR